MQTDDNRSNELDQKEIIVRFIQNVREKKFLTQEDFREVFEFFCQIVDCECRQHNISVECVIKDNKLKNLPQSVANGMDEREWAGIDIAGCDYSDSKGKDATLFLDPVFFCKKYFGRDEEKDRLEGIVEVLISTYHEVDHAIKQTNLLRGQLRPENIEISKEIFLREILGGEFYNDNYGVLSFEKNAEEYSYNRTLENLSELDILEIAKKNISDKKSKQNGLANSKLGKIKYMGITQSRDKFLEDECSREIWRYPSFLYSSPILARKYNADGSAKNIVKLFDDMQLELRKIIQKHFRNDSQSEFTPELEEEYFNCEKFYYELILPRVGTSYELEYKELVKKYGVKPLQKFLSGMEKYVNDKAQERLSYTGECSGQDYESPDEIKLSLQSNINAIVRFKNGARYNDIAEELLREGGFIRGTREIPSEEAEKRNIMLANSLIGVYDAIESEWEYEKRAESEKSDIDEVVNALYYNRFDTPFNSIEYKDTDEVRCRNLETVRIIHILKMARILSAETGQDYFREFLKIPDVSEKIKSFEKDKSGYLDDCINISQTRIKKVLYPPTEAEEGKYKEYIVASSNNETARRISMLNKEFSGPMIRRGWGNER